MKCNNVFTFKNLHLQDGIVFAGRLTVAGILCFLWILLKGKLSADHIGYAKIAQFLFILWCVYTVYEYALSWIFPRVKSISFEQDKIIINETDTYTYTKDAFIATRIMRFTPIDMNLYLNIRDEAEGKNRIYWFGNIFWCPEAAKFRDVKEKISSFERKLFEKFAYAYLCEESTEDNTFINVDIKRINKEHLIEDVMLYVSASILMLIAMINILILQFFALLFISSVALFVLAILNGIAFRRDSKVFINTAEITRTGIRFDSDLFTIGKDLNVTFLSTDKDKKEMGFWDRGYYIKISDGKNTKRFWLGPTHLYHREQILVHYVLDSIVKYLKASADA